MANIDGTSGNDSLTGTASDETIEGGAGNDTITGGGGGDLIYGDVSAALTGNRITNGDFSSGLTGWTINNPSGNQPPRDYGDGRASFNSDNETTYGDSIQQSFRANAGQQQTLTLDLTENGNSSGNHTFRIDVLDANGTVIGTTTQTVNNGGTLPVSLNFTSTTTTNTLVITNTTSTASSSTDGQVDNVVIQPSGPLPANFYDSGDDRISAGSGNDTVDGGIGNDTIAGDDFIATGPNLIVNGSFEDTTGTTAMPWGFSGYGGSITGWTDANGYRIDLHNDGRGGLTATDGTNWIDMEGGSGEHMVISQSVAGINSGQVYALRFDLADLSDANDGTALDNQLQVIWNGEVIATIDPTDGSWSNYEFYLIGGSGNGANTLTFAGFGSNDELGVSLDNIQMFATTEATGGADSLVGGDGDDDLMGGAGNDTIDGGDGADMIVAGSGADSVLGGSGNDSIWGDDGNDSLYGGDGDDSLIGGAGDDTLFFGTGDNQVFGGDGDDYIDDVLSGYETGTNLIDGGAGNDTIWFGAGDTTVYGGDGNDYIDDHGGELSGFNLVDAGSGDDTVYAGFDDDTVYGGAGHDLLYGDDGSDQLYGEDGDDTLEGGAGNDLLVGGAGDDSLIGGADDDTLYAGLGSDTLLGGDGNDLLIRDGTDVNDTPNVLSGGAGDDTIRLQDGLNVNDQIDGGDGTDLLEVLPADNRNITVDMVLGEVADGAVGTQQFVNIENITSGGGNDTIIGNDSDNVLSGGAGNDEIYGGLGNDTLIGGAGDDYLAGGVGTDSVLGGDGADTLFSIGGGADTLSGGADGDTFDLRDLSGQTIIGGETTTTGTDTDRLTMQFTSDPVTVTFTGNEAGTISDGVNSATFSEIEQLSLGDGNDSVYGGTITSGASVNSGGGDDLLDFNASSGANTLEGAGGADSITGGTGNDLIDGGADNDFLVGNAGNDTLNAGGDNDQVFGGDGDDSIDGGAGDDELYGGAGADTMLGGDGIDSLYGGTEDDVLVGGNGNDNLWGEAGNDSLYGDAGDDLIIGGLGDDFLSGGDGIDTFSYIAGEGHDTISDFNTGNTGTLDDGIANEDYIDLSGFYDHISELRIDFSDDGILNQSNTVDEWGRAVDYSDNTQFGAGSLTFTGATTASFSDENTGVVCFTKGTAIRTPQGDRLIETLRVGDLVTTMDNGPQRIIWIGRRTLDHTQLLANPKFRPVMLQPGVLGLERGLLVSRQHGILVGQDRLVRAIHLARRLPGVRVANGKRAVCYIHLMFEAHQIIFAENIPAESFYPGPMALSMMAEPTLEDLRALLPGVARGLGNLAQSYGPTVREFQKLNGVHANALVA